MREESTESILHFHDGGWYVYLGFRKPKHSTREEVTENGTILSADLGVNEIAVTSNDYQEPVDELNHDR